MHDNRGTRLLRVGLMVVLQIMLAVALLPTGSDCVSRSALGAPVKCCFAEIGRKSFTKSFNSTNGAYSSMIFSEILLLTSFLTRIIKLFHWSSRCARLYLRQKPGAVWKRFLNFNCRLLQESKAGIRRKVLLPCYCINNALFIIVRGLFDLAESMLWEVCVDIRAHIIERY